MPVEATTPSHGRAVRAAVLAGAAIRIGYLLTKWNQPLRLNDSYYYSGQAYQLAQAVLHMARNQMLMEQRLGGRMEAVEGRLETIEDALSQPGRMITEDQASQISQAVKAVALAIGKKSGRNEFGAIYGELYRKFGIAGYKQLPARRFQEAMRFLAEWHENVTGGPLPF